jgi:hypothetical protein
MDTTLRQRMPVPTFSFLLTGMYCHATLQFPHFYGQSRVEKYIVFSFNLVDDTPGLTLSMYV